MGRRCRFMYIVMTFVLMISGSAGQVCLPAAAKMKEGKNFRCGTYRYRILSLRGKVGTVSLTGTENRSIASVKIPETVTKNGCKFTVTSIGNAAFKNCRKLRALKTNTGLKVIGKNAFKGCKRQKNIDITTTHLKKVGKNAFKRISAQAVITVPAGKLSAYSRLLKNKGLKETVKIEAGESGKSGYSVSASVGTVSNSQTPIKKANPPEIHTAAKETERPESGTAAPTDASSPAPSASQKPNQTSIEPDTVSAPEITGELNPTAEPDVTGSPDIARASAMPEETKAPADTGILGTEQATKSPAATVPPEATATPEATGTPEATATPVASAVHTHNYENWKILRETSCVIYGLKEGTCSVCGATRQEIIPALSHKLEPTSTIAPTCTQRGAKYYECSVCRQVFFHVIPSLGGHEWEDTFTVDVKPSCTEDGSMSRHCRHEGCNERLDIRVIQSAGGHRFPEELTIEKKASCTESGLGVRKCLNCDEKQYEIIPATGHSYSGDFVIEKKATCMSPGTMSKTCTLCGHKQTASIPKLNHAFRPKPLEQEGVCCDGGSVVAECEECGGKMIITVPSGHDWDDELTLDRAPSCRPGIKSRHCKRDGCERRTDYVVLPGTGHTWVNGVCSVCGQGKPKHRHVWGVVYYADTSMCEGYVDDRGETVSCIWKTTIVENEDCQSIQIKAPQAKQGFHFVGWKDASDPHGEILDRNPERIDTWESMDRAYEAVYAAD